MENPLDPTDQDPTQPVTADLEALETETGSEPSVDTEDEATNEPDVIDESSTTLITQTKKGLPGKAATKPVRTQEELPSNPLLLDPYEWDVR